MSGDREDERPGTGRSKGERPVGASGATERRCAEAQADGVPCDNVASACEECERAETGAPPPEGWGAA